MRNRPWWRSGLISHISNSSRDRCLNPRFAKRRTKIEIKNSQETLSVDEKDAIENPTATIPFLEQKKRTRDQIAKTRNSTLKQQGFQHENEFHMQSLEIKNY